MTDIELLNLVFNYTYRNGGCDDIQVMLKNNHGIEIDIEKRHQLFQMMIATGFAKEDSYAYGNHPHISMSDEGMKIMIEYGEYRTYCKANKSHLEMRQRGITLEQVSCIAGIIGVLIALLSWLC